MDSWKSSAARKKINRCGKKEDQQARNVREVAKCCVFRCFVSAGSKSNLAKAAGAEVAFQLGNEKLHAAVARSTFSIKMRLSLHVRTTFWSWDVEKLHAAVARSTFSIKMRFSLHARTTFWSWDVEKLHAAAARSTFASQNAKKLTVSGHFKIVEKWHAAVAPSTCTSQNVQNTCVLRHFWRFHFASSLTNWLKN